MDKTADTMNISSVNINTLVERILKQLRPIAAKNNIEVVFESFRPVTAEVDEVKLSLAITNLVENAIKYNQENGWVHVALNADHKLFYIEVADSGIGIAPEETDHIFERFYRVDNLTPEKSEEPDLDLRLQEVQLLCTEVRLRFTVSRKRNNIYSENSIDLRVIERRGSMNKRRKFTALLGFLYVWLSLCPVRKMIRVRKLMNCIM